MGHHNRQPQAFHPPPSRPRPFRKPLRKPFSRPHPQARREEQSAGPGLAPRRTSPALPTSANPLLPPLRHGGLIATQRWPPPLAPLGRPEDRPLYDTRPEHSEGQPTVTLGACAGRSEAEPSARRGRGGATASACALLAAATRRGARTAWGAGAVGSAGQGAGGRCPALRAATRGGRGHPGGAPPCACAARARPLPCLCSGLGAILRGG